MQLIRETSCVKNRHYRTELPLRCSIARVRERLMHAGWRDESDLHGLLRLVSPEEHQLLIVSRSRRVQIRVAYVVPETERRWAAESVFVSLVHLVDSEGA